MKFLYVLFAIFLIGTSIIFSEAKKCHTVPAHDNCPSCSSPPFAAVNTCTCGARGAPVLRKYACGPACDAIGYCCP